jgi:hypothetical protein
MPMEWMNEWVNAWNFCIIYNKINTVLSKYTSKWVKFWLKIVETHSLNHDVKQFTFGGGGRLRKVQIWSQSTTINLRNLITFLSTELLTCVGKLYAVVFRAMTPWNLVGTYHISKEIYCFSLQNWGGCNSDMEDRILHCTIQQATSLW